MLIGGSNTTYFIAKWNYKKEPMRKEGALMSDKPRVYCYIRIRDDYARLEWFAEEYDEKLRPDKTINYMGLMADTEYRNNWVRLAKMAEDGKVDKIVASELADIGDGRIDQLEQVKRIYETKADLYFVKEDKSIRDEYFMDTLIQSIGIVNAIKEEKKMLYHFGLTRTDANGNGVKIAPYGYDWDDYDNMIVNTEEAQIVKRIFKMYLEGDSLNAIAVKLEKMGARPKLQGTKWYASTIKSILLSSRYCEGVADQRYKPIIDIETFERVQKLYEQKRHKPRYGTRTINKDPMSGKVKCGICGKSYTFHRGRDKYHKSKWVCLSRVKYGKEGCDAALISEEEMKAMLVKSFNEYVDERLFRTNETYLTDNVANMYESLKELRKLHAEGYITKEQYKKQTTELSTELARRTDLLKQVGYKVPGITKDSKSTKYDDRMVDFLISVTVYPGRKLTFLFD